MAFEAQIKVSASTIVKVEGADIKEVFRRRSEAEEVMGEESCGLCQSKKIRYVVRKAAKGAKSYEFFECHCKDCGARLAFGQSTDTVSLFPKRKLTENGEPNMEDGIFGQHNGWSKFKGDPKE
jgi:hypothetical protein